METPSLAQIKAELNHLKHSELLLICLRLSRFKRENKELLAYLLFQQNQPQDFVASVNLHVSETLAHVNTTNGYFAKKTIRKALRDINKYCRYAGNAELEVQILIHFCICFLALPNNIKSYPVLEKLFKNQEIKIAKKIAELHEDLQYDYLRQLQNLSTGNSKA